MFQNLKEKLGSWFVAGAFKEGSFRQRILIWFGRKEADKYLKGDEQMEGKKIWESKTFWLAVVQAGAGIFAAAQASNPTLQAGGIGLLVKSAIDILLRVLTDKPVA